jgi:Helix-turn-helix domain
MDKPPSDQLELFKSLPRAKAKLFRSANGPDLLYWRLPSDKYRVELSDGALIDITKQSPGRSGHPRLYTKIPGSGQDIVQARNLKAILAQIALLDQIRALNKSIQIKSKQQDDAARTLSDLTKREGVPKPERWTNTLALEWALDQELATGTKAVLVTFAAHCNAVGETWPSVKRIAEKWKMDRDTVRVAIRDLIDEKLLVDTGKRAGSTRQVKVYRLPAIAFESGGDGHLFKEDGSADKAPEKRRESGGDGHPE